MICKVVRPVKVRIAKKYVIKCLDIGTEVVYVRKDFFNKHLGLPPLLTFHLKKYSKEYFQIGEADAKWHFDAQIFGSNYNQIWNKVVYSS
jgi:hypothetical protein